MPGKMEPRKCVECGRMFSPNNHRQICCTHKCCLARNNRRCLERYHAKRAMLAPQRADRAAPQIVGDREFVAPDGARRRVIPGKLRSGETVRVELRGSCPAGPHNTYGAQALVRSMAGRYL